MREDQGATCHHTSGHCFRELLRYEDAVAPGILETDMTQVLTDEQRAQVARRSALNRLAEVGDVANTVEFLLSDKARNITGTVITVDAGATA